MKIRASAWMIALHVSLLVVCVHPVWAQEKPSAETISRRLDTLLLPQSKSPPSAPATWPGNKAVEKPEPLPRPLDRLPPKPPVTAGKATAPRPAPEGMPPVAYGTLPALPGPVELPTQPLVMLPALDVESPLPLPHLAKPKADRATLDDTTLEASQAAALRPFSPRRMQPVPFAPINLPDPFENLRDGGLRNMPEESPQPPATPIRTPR
jgi:hypothetical protein